MLAKAPIPNPSAVKLLANVGLVFVLQQMPLTVTGDPPSDVIVPPLEAVALIIEETPVVVRVGNWFDEFLMQRTEKPSFLPLLKPNGASVFQLLNMRIQTLPPLLSVELHQKPLSPNSQKLPLRLRDSPGSPVKPLLLSAPVLGLVQWVVPASFILPPATDWPPK